MNFTRAAKSSALVVVVALLLGGSFYVNAATQVSPKPNVDTGSTASGVTFTLIHVSSTSSGGTIDRNATGEAGVAVVQGPTEVATEIVVNQATPGAVLEAVMAINSSTQSTTSVLATSVADSSGHAGFSTKSSLAPGIYYVGLRIYDTSNTGSTLVLVSSPSVGRLVVPTATTTSTTATTSTAAQSSSSSSGITFALVHSTTSSAASLDRNATGYGGIVVQGLTQVATEVVVNKATPGAVLMAVEMINSSAASTTATVGTAVVDSSGHAGFSYKSALYPGVYYIGLKIYDTTNKGSTLVLVSSPSYGRLVIATPTTTTTTQSTTSQPGATTTWGFTLVPLESPPIDIPFKQGGAAITGYGYTLQIVFSFLGTPDTAFNLVLSRADANVSLGTVTTSSTGGGVFKTNTTLNSGTYSLGLLVFASGNVVAVSSPRSVSVVMPISYTSSTTTHSTTSTAHTTTQTSTSTSRPEGSNSLAFYPITSSNLPSNYQFGSGTMAYGVYGAGIGFSGVFTGQAPNTHFLIVMSVNGTSKTVGDYTTDGDGVGHVGATAVLGPGTFVISLTIDDASFNTPTPVLAGRPASILVHVTATESTSTTRSTTETTHSTTTYNHGAEFKLVPITTVTGAPQGYKFGNGEAYISLSAKDGTAALDISIDGANPSTNYSVALSINGTSTDVGSITTNRDGSAELRGSVQMHTGTYVVGMTVYDTSTFKTATAVLQSYPLTETIIVQGAPTSSSTTSSSSSSHSQTSTSTTTALTKINEDTGLHNQIKDAFNNLTIPVVVSVTGSSSSTSVLDSRFSVSVGSQTNNGLTITVSGTNVTGPRVLLLNLSRSSHLASVQALNVTLDGQPVAEASSATQVLDPSPDSPPLYVVVSSSGGIQLLISIPHFSVHLIGVSGIAAAAAAIQSALELDSPILAGSILLVTIIFASLYAARRRIYTFL